MPSSEKTVSVMMAPPSTAPKFSAITVTIGIKRVAEDVTHDHAPFRDALRAGGAHVVGVQHVEHRRPHEPAVERKADHAQRDDRQPDVLQTIERPRALVRAVQPGRVEDADVPLQIDVDEEDL